MMNPMGMGMKPMMSHSPMDLNTMRNQANVTLQNQTNMNQMQRHMNHIGDGRMLSPMAAQRQLLMQSQMPPTPPAVPNSFQQGGGSMGQVPQFRGGSSCAYWNQQ
eukprot:10202373-Heterocapsa_arctica.AAC.1